MGDVNLAARYFDLADESDESSDIQADSHKCKSFMNRSELWVCLKRKRIC